MGMDWDPLGREEKGTLEHEFTGVSFKLYIMDRKTKDFGRHTHASYVEVKGQLSRGGKFSSSALRLGIELTSLNFCDKCVCPLSHLTDPRNFPCRNFTLPIIKLTVIYSDLHHICRKRCHNPKIHLANYSELRCFPRCT